MEDSSSINLILPKKLDNLIPDWIKNLSIKCYEDAYLMEKPGKKYINLNNKDAVNEERDNNWFLSKLYCSSNEVELTLEEHKKIGFYIFNKIETYLRKNFPKVKFQLLMIMQTDEFYESKVYFEKFRKETSFFTKETPFYFIDEIRVPGEDVEYIPTWQKIVN